MTRAKTQTVRTPLGTGGKYKVYGEYRWKCSLPSVSGTFNSLANRRLQGRIFCFGPIVFEVKFIGVNFISSSLRR